jgi:hypothetical protein
MNLVETIAIFSSSNQLKLFLASTFRSSSGGRSLSGTVLNFGDGGSIFLGMAVAALKAGPVSIGSRESDGDVDVDFPPGKGKASVRVLKRRRA